MSELRTVILAAGKGTRMKSDVPKVLHLVLGKPIIQYVIDVAKAVGSLKNYVVLGHQADMVAAVVGKDCEYVNQTELLGTGDAVKRTKKLLKNFNGNVLILCGDTPLLDKKVVKQLVSLHNRKKAVCTFLTAVLDNPFGYGRIVRDKKGNAVAIHEHGDATSDERNIKEINVGVYCVRSKDLFAALDLVKLNAKKKELYLTDMVEYFAKKGMKVETVVTDDPDVGLGVNTREQLALAGLKLRDKIVQYWMEQGVTIMDPISTFIAPDVTIGKDTLIRPFTFIENNVKLGARCVVGPFVRFRPGTRIGNNVDIGNFTEVNNSSMGDGCFMKHFSYLGDAVLGKNVNIGAGTVTANFNGIKKNETKIGDGAFIGSDSILVAPVTVGKGALTGAGSVVTAGTKVPPGYAAIGVPARLRRRKTL
ncbi:MAG: NTP transferase domain-containing protein [Candidatus Omnitrophica bacterium]|nr:NTP transferase domain-containing protein [Candidatus Omnitrophota bacterium]